MPPSCIPQWVAHSNSNAPLAIPQAQDLSPIDGKTPHYKCMLELPNSLVAHILGHQGQGLKQAYDISSSWLATFLVGLAENSGCQFVTIRSTNQQIGEALMVFEKCITKQYVHVPQKQHSGNAALALS